MAEEGCATPAHTRERSVALPTAISNPLGNSYQWRGSCPLIVESLESHLITSASVLQTTNILFFVLHRNMNMTVRVMTYSIVYTYGIIL